MALADNPHHSYRWGFCFPACRPSPPLSQWPHLHRLAGVLVVLRPMPAQCCARLLEPSPMLISKPARMAGWSAHGDDEAHIFTRVRMRSLFRSGR
jgi:hypothetical protein